MAHLTQQQERQIYQLAVGMFGAAPGVQYFNEIHDALEAGLSMTQIYEALVNSPSFQAGGFAFTPAATDEQFVDAFLDRLLGPGTENVTQAGRDFAESFLLAQLAAGRTRGEVIQIAVEALDAVPESDPDFGEAAGRLDNRIEVAENFTEVQNGTSPDVAFLQQRIANVTADDATVQAQIIANAGAAGQQFTLDTDPDNITGSAQNDTVFGVLDGANSTFTAADIINLAGGVNDLLKITVVSGVGALPAAQVSGTEGFLIRDLGAGGTYDFSLYQGETTVANDRSTADVIFNNIEPGATLLIQGDGTTVLGDTTFKMTSATTPVAITIAGGVTDDTSDITRDQTGNAAVTINSIGGENQVGVIDLDTVAAIKNVTINATTDLEASLDATDYAASSTLTLTGAGGIDLLTQGNKLATNITTVNASGSSGGVSLILGANTTNFTGGAGNDVVGVDALVFNSTGKVDGGAGINTLRVTDDLAVTAETAANLSNFQVLRVDDNDDGAAETINTSLISGIVAVEIGAMSAADGVVLNNLNATRASAVTIMGNQVVGPTFGVTGATTVGQLDVLGITINDTLTAKNTITVANLTANGVETVNINAVDNLTLSSATGLGALTNMNVTGSGNVNITTGALAANVNTVINASALTGTFTFNASGATANGLAITGSATKANTITGTNQNDVINGGSANDTIKAGNGVDTVNISQGGDDIVNLEGVVAAANRDNFTGFTAGTFSTGSGVDRIEMDDAQATTAFGAAAATFQTVTSAPTSALTFTTDTANVLELAFEFPGGNGGATDLDDANDGTELLAGLAQTLAVAADGDLGYIIAYQDGRAYLYQVTEDADLDVNVDDVADIQLVGRFDGIAVGAFTASNFIDAA